MDFNKAQAYKQLFDREKSLAYEQYEIDKKIKYRALEIAHSLRDTSNRLENMIPENFAEFVFTEPKIERFCRSNVEYGMVMVGVGTDRETRILYWLDFPMACLWDEATYQKRREELLSEVVGYICTDKPIAREDFNKLFYGRSTTK